jgi:hypothetical protein
MKTRRDYPTKRTPKTGMDYADYLIADAKAGNITLSTAKCLIKTNRYEKTKHIKIYSATSNYSTSKKIPRNC